MVKETEVITTSWFSEHFIERCSLIIHRVLNRVSLAVSDERRPGWGVRVWRGCSHVGVPGIVD